MWGTPDTVLEWADQRISKHNIARPLQMRMLQLLNSIKIFFFFFTFWLHLEACGILVTPPGIEPALHALDVHNLNYWTAREVPEFEHV